MTQQLWLTIPATAAIHHEKLVWQSFLGKKIVNFVVCSESSHCYLFLLPHGRASERENSRTLQLQSIEAFICTNRGAPNYCNEAKIFSNIFEMP